MTTATVIAQLARGRRHLSLTIGLGIVVTLVAVALLVCSK